MVEYNILQEVSLAYYEQKVSKGITSLIVRVRVIVFNAPFNNISVLSWWSVLMVEETGVLGENH
jgi:hypothetical protein